MRIGLDGKLAAGSWAWARPARKSAATSDVRAFMDCDAKPVMDSSSPPIIASQANKSRGCGDPHRGKVLRRRIRFAHLQFWEQTVLDQAGQELKRWLSGLPGSP